MPVNIDISEDTLKEVLKAAGVAVATLGLKYLYRGTKVLYNRYQEKKDVKMSMTWGQRIKELLLVALSASAFTVLIFKIIL